MSLLLHEHCPRLIGRSHPPPPIGPLSVSADCSPPRGAVFTSKLMPAPRRDCGPSAGLVTQLQSGGHRDGAGGCRCRAPCRWAEARALMFLADSAPAVSASTERPAVTSSPTFSAAVPGALVPLQAPAAVGRSDSQTSCFWFFSWGPVSRVFFDCKIYFYFSAF